MLEESFYLAKIAELEKKIKILEDEIRYLKQERYLKLKNKNYF